MIKGYWCLTDKTKEAPPHTGLADYNAWENRDMMILHIFGWNLLFFLVFCVVHHIKAGINNPGFNHKEEIRKA